MPRRLTDHAVNPANEGPVKPTTLADVVRDAQSGGKPIAPTCKAGRKMLRRALLQQVKAAQRRSRGRS